MGASKTEHYSPYELNMSKFAKALAHPARWRIVNIIAEQGPRTCYQIMDFIPLSQSTISQHLATLQTCGVLTPAYLFNETIYYCLSARSLSFLVKGIQEVVNTQENVKLIS